MSFESRCVRYFSNMLLETAPYRRSCVGKASLSEFDACPSSLIFAGTGGAQTSTGLQICFSGDFLLVVNCTMPYLAPFPRYSLRHDCLISLYLATHLAFNPRWRGSPGTISINVARRSADGYCTKWRRNISNNVHWLSRVHESYRDKQQTRTDWFAIASTRT